MLGPRPGVTVTGDFIAIRNREVVDETIARLQQAGEAFRIPAFRAARDGRLNLLMAKDGGLVPPSTWTLKRPTIVILADDIPTATGPGHWPQAVELIRWAKCCTLHATGGTAQHYQDAVTTAEVSGRLLLIEVQYFQYVAWFTLIRHVAPDLPLTCVLPTGGAHPVPGPPAGEAAQ